MNKRFSMGKIFPEAFKAMDGLDQLFSDSSPDAWYYEMIRIRASYINGCAYCADCHTNNAVRLGVASRKITLIPVWREAGSIFSEQEQGILLLTEEISLIHQKGVSDDVYNKVIGLFGEKQTATFIMAIITINAWNRIGVGLKIEPPAIE